MTFIGIACEGFGSGGMGGEGPQPAHAMLVAHAKSTKE